MIGMLEDIVFLARAPWRTCIGEKVTEENIPSRIGQKVKCLWKPQEAGLVAKPRERCGMSVSSNWCSHLGAGFRFFPLFEVEADVW